LVEVADAERKRIQRNLHDGAQQRLTSALLCLGRVRATSSDPVPMLERAVDELSTGLDEIRELANGLHPSILTERGLTAALKSLALRSPVPVEVAAQLDDSLAEQVEAAAYYVVAEALANVHKHAGARRVVVRAAMRAGMLEVSIDDDGAGGADAGSSGLRGLADRASKRSAAG
jgi:signal transduction histidine kinase